MMFSDTDEDETGYNLVICALLGGCGANVRAPRARALCGAPRNCNNQHNETIPPAALLRAVALSTMSIKEKCFKNTFTFIIL